MRIRLGLAILALLLGGFCAGLWTAILATPPAPACTQEVPNAKVETDLTYPVTPEVPNPRSRGLTPDFL